LGLVWREQGFYIGRAPVRYRLRRLLERSGRKAAVAVPAWRDAVGDKLTLLGLYVCDGSLGQSLDRFTFRATRGSRTPGEFLGTVAVLVTPVALAWIALLAAGGLALGAVWLLCAAAAKAVSCRG